MNYASPAEKLARVLAIIVIGFAMFLISGFMLNPHPAAQERLPVKVTNVIHDPIGADHNHQLLVVEGLTPDQPVLSTDWEGNATVGMHTDVSVRLPLNDRDYAQQYPYPHAYHWFRWFTFIVLAICGLVFTIRSYRRIVYY